MKKYKASDFTKPVQSEIDRLKTMHYEPFRMDEIDDKQWKMLAEHEKRIRQLRNRRRNRRYILRSNAPN